MSSNTIIKLYFMVILRGERSFSDEWFSRYGFWPNFGVLSPAEHISPFYWHFQWYEVYMSQNTLIKSYSRLFWGFNEVFLTSGSRDMEFGLILPILTVFGGFRHILSGVPILVSIKILSWAEMSRQTFLPKNFSLICDIFSYYYYL